jgi:tetratricopeptide (TPR) repeat protein
MVLSSRFAIIADRSSHSRTKNETGLKTLVTILTILVACATSFAQKKNDAAVRKGNELYKQKNFEASQQEYNKALADNPKDPTAHYNNGNAQFKSNKMEDAVASYENTIGNSNVKPVREKAFYNKGVALAKQQKLQESIDAWKESLKTDPNDNDARENLQKALLELKKQQEQNKKQQDKQQQDKQQKKQDQKPQQQQSKLTKQQVEQLLKAMQQKEKEVQQKLQKGQSSPNKPEKDW